MHDVRLDRLAKVLVNYSVAVTPGDLVRISGSPICEALVVAVYREVLQAGGHPIVRMNPEACQETLLRFANDDQLNYLNPLALTEIETIHCDIGILGTQNTRALSKADSAKQARLSRAKKPFYDVFDKREENNTLRWVVTEFPTHAAAQDAEMSLTEYEDFVFGAGKVDSDEAVSAWTQLRDRQARICEYLNKAKRLRFKTSRADRCTDLSMVIEGRQWINCHGRRNFPDGEVYTGPHEDSTNGIIYYDDFPAVYGGREVHGICLKFVDGRVTEASAQKGEEFLLKMLDQDPGARILGEIGIGTNYSITRFSKNTLFDEKIGGTFHAALGASYPKSGGKNTSSLHWDMVCDLRNGGEIWVDDDRLISKNGRFTDASWPQPQ